MKKIIYLNLLLMFFVGGVNASSLSPQARISLVTIGPGPELYSTFGHTAVWVFDPVNGVNIVYNYGTFEFSSDFYMKFTRGKLDYMLSASTMDHLMAGAQYENRYVVNQELNLSPFQKDKLYQFLENNLLPENKYYRYDFFFDNCSSRVRDALKKVCGDSLAFNYKPKELKSFRQLINEYLGDKQWQDMGMDIGLGMPADRKATPYDYMFLPEYLRISFDSASLNKNGKIEPLVLDTRILFEPVKTKMAKINIFTPNFFFTNLLIIALIITAFTFRKNPKRFVWDSILFFISGLLGLLIVFLWFGTDHNVTVSNWNIIWASPLNLVIAILLLFKIKSKYLYIYCLVYGVMIFLLVGTSAYLPQELNRATIPFMILLSARSLYLYLKLRPAEAVEVVEKK